MPFDYTHVLVFDVELLSVNNKKTGLGGYAQGVKYELVKEKLKDAFSVEAVAKAGVEILHVAAYNNILLCSCKLGEPFIGKTTTEKTKVLETVLVSLFQNGEMAFFQWMIQAKKDLDDQNLNGTITKTTSGASGGGNIGNRG